MMRRHPCSRARGAGRKDHAIENASDDRGTLATCDAGPRRIDDADVARIAHVGYDIEAIGPFIDALEAAGRRRCVAVLMDRVPASAADPFWPPVRPQTRVPLPRALPGVLRVTLLRRVAGDRASSMGRRRARRFPSHAESAPRTVRRQLWIERRPGPKEVRSRLRSTNWRSPRTANGRSPGAVRAMSAS